MHISPKKLTQKFLQKRACGSNGNCSCGCEPEYPRHVDVELVRLADGESYMSVQSLQSMVDHAQELLTKINEGTDLPDWVEAKIIRAAAGLEDVMEYFSHGGGQRLASGALPVTLKKDIVLKDGTTIREGSKGVVKFREDKPQYAGVWFDSVGRDITLATKRLSEYFGRPFQAIPQPRALGRMGDGIAKSVTGHKVEPDGYGPDGSPSWLLALSLI